MSDIRVRKGGGEGKGGRGDISPYPQCAVSPAAKGGEKKGREKAENVTAYTKTKRSGRTKADRSKGKGRKKGEEETKLSNNNMEKSDRNSIGTRGEKKRGGKKRKTVPGWCFVSLRKEEGGRGGRWAY